MSAQIIQAVLGEQVAKQVKQACEEAYNAGSNAGERDAIRRAISGLTSDQLVDFIFRYAGASMADVSNFDYQRLFTIRQMLLRESVPQDVIDRILRVRLTPNGCDPINGGPFAVISEEEYFRG